MTVKILPKIIGLAGTNGAGKDSVGAIIAKEYNYMFISCTDILREELAKRNIPAERAKMRQLSAEWRKKYGLGVLIDKSKTVFELENKGEKGFIVSSLRNVGEVDEVHDLGGIVLWIDADPQFRFNRLQANKKSRGKKRDIDDDVTFREFLAAEEAEMYSKDKKDNTLLDMAAVKVKCDLVLINEYKTLDELSGAVLNMLSA